MRNNHLYDLSMKVRVKGTTKKVFDAIDLSDLHKKVTEDQNLSETVILSLNGSDPIPSAGAFSDHGIVNGDLVRIISFNPEEKSDPHTSMDTSRPSTHSEKDQMPKTSFESTDTKILKMDEILKKYQLEESNTPSSVETRLEYIPVPSAEVVLVKQTISDWDLTFNLK